MDPILTSIVVLVAASVGVGWAAQKERGRIGAVWAALTIALAVVWWALWTMYFDASGISGVELQIAFAELRRTSSVVASLVAAVFYVGAPTFLMFLVVATLPSRVSTQEVAQSSPLLTTTKETSSEPRRPCPLCAELILRAAKVCPHCRSELPNDWAEQSGRGRYTGPAT